MVRFSGRSAASGLLNYQSEGFQIVIAPEFRRHRRCLAGYGTSTSATQTFQHIGAETVRGKPVGVGTAQEPAARLNQGRGQPSEFGVVAVGAEGVLAAAREGRRIEDDAVKAPALPRETAHPAEGITLDPVVHGRIESVKPEIFPSPIEVGAGEVGGRRLGPRPGRHYRKTAGVGEGVEDAVAGPGPLAHPATIEALVGENAGRIPRRKVDPEGGPIFPHREAFGHRLPGDEDGSSGRGFVPGAPIDRAGPAPGQVQHGIRQPRLAGLDQPASVEMIDPELTLRVVKNAPSRRVGPWGRSQSFHRDSLRLVAFPDSTS